MKSNIYSIWWLYPISYCTFFLGEVVLRSLSFAQERLATVRFAIFWQWCSEYIPYETNQRSASLHYQWQGHFWKQKTINKTSRQHKQHHYAQNLQYMKDTLMNADWNPQYKKNKSKQPCARMMMNPKRTDHLAETVEATGTKSYM